MKILKLLLPILLILTLFFSCKEDICTVDVTITVKNGLDGVNVKIGDYTARTTEEGVVTIKKVRVGTHQVTLEKDGYEPKSEPIDIKCEPEESPDFELEPNRPIISVEPSILDFGDDSNILTLTIKNVGKNGLNYEIKKIPSFIKISDEDKTGTFTGNEKSISVELQRGELSGNEGEVVEDCGNCQFEITSQQGGNEIVNLRAIVVAPFTVTSNELDFGRTSSPRSFLLKKRTGFSNVNFTLSTNREWIELEKEAGRLDNVFSEDEIEVNINRDLLNSNFDNGVITVNGEGYIKKIDVLVTDINPNAPTLEANLSRINFGESRDEVLLTIRNSGLDNLNWQITNPLHWLSVNTSSTPTLSAGEEYTIKFFINRDDINNTHSGSIDINSNGGDLTLPVQVEHDPIISSLDATLAHYRFNGDANNEENANSPGFVEGAVLAEDRNGNIDHCYYLNGNNAFIGIDNPIGRDSEVDYSIAFWMNNHSISSSKKYIFSLRGNYILEFFTESENGNNYLNFSVTTKTSSSANSQRHILRSSNYSDFQWLHVIGIFTPSRTSHMTLYINGEVVNRRAIEHRFSIGYDSRSSAIGAFDQSSNYWEGYIDDVRIYGRELNDEEIRHLYCIENNSPDCQ